MAHLALGLAIAFACFGMSVDARPSRQSESTSSRAQLSSRDETPAYSPIPPSALSDVEFRPSTSSPSIGDYVATGLGAEMDLVAQEYGLRDSESFYWGLDGVPLANLTAFAEGEDVKVLSVERFVGVLESAQCSNTSIKLTFTQEADFQDVLSAWTWINDADENYVVLVTDNSQCNVADGDDTVRQPWHITHATFDDNANTVALDAQPKTWDDAFGTWHLAIDSRGFLSPQQDQRRRRSSQRRSPHNVTIDLTHDLSGISTTLPNGGSITCAQCSTTGELDFSIDIGFSIADGVTGYFDVVAHDVATQLGFEINLRAGESVHSMLSFYTWEPTTGFGKIQITGIAELTPQLSFGIAASTTVTDDVLITTGVDAGVTDGSNAHFNFANASASHTGWTPTFTPHDTHFSENVNVIGSIGPQLRLAYHGQTIRPLSWIVKTSADVGLMLTAPELIMNATVFERDDASSYNCSTPVEDEGISFQLDLGLDFDAFEDATVVVKTIAATQPIYTTASLLYSTCILSTEAIPTNAPGYPGPNNGTYPLPGTNGTIPSGYAPYGSASCPVHGELVCNGENYFALCNWGTAIWQPVADGTACEDGAIVGTGDYADPSDYSSDDASTDCPVNGQLLCNGADQYGLCNWGSVIWQPVAAGTQCQQGQIVRRGVYASPTPTPRAMFRVLK